MFFSYTVCTAYSVKYLNIPFNVILREGVRECSVKGGENVIRVRLWISDLETVR
jgi:hypothetical protein